MSVVLNLSWLSNLETIYSNHSSQKEAFLIIKCYIYSRFVRYYRGYCSELYEIVVK